MNIRFAGEKIRIRLSTDDAKQLLIRNSLDAATRFPNGKRFRYGLRVAQIPDTDEAPPIVLSFTTEGGGFGADLVLVLLRRDIERLLASAGSKTENITSQFETPESECLSVTVEVDALKANKAK